MSASQCSLQHMHYNNSLLLSVALLQNADMDGTLVRKGWLTAGRPAGCTVVLPVAQHSKQLTHNRAAAQAAGKQGICSLGCSALAARACCLCLQTVPVIDFADMRRRVGVPVGMDILDYISTLSPEGAERAHSVIEDIEEKALQNMQIMPGALELCRLLDGKGLPRYGGNGRPVSACGLGKGPSGGVLSR